MSFQSTHPRRVWLTKIWFSISKLWFQSTHPRRVWLNLQVLPALMLQFQSTHPRRVWHTIDNRDPKTQEFQSTHPRRVWRKEFIIITSNPCFNPHTHEGCDSSSFALSLDKFVSIHTPTKGVTNIFNVSHISSLFQSTHPRRVWLHIQQIAEYHDAKIIILRKMAK